MTKTKTKQEYIEIIRKACIKTDESILDLVFGCEVMDTEYGRTDIYNFGSMTDTFVFLHRDNNENQEWKKRFNEHFKIIGRKIGIAEVLVAMNKAGHYMTIDIVGDIEYKGKFEYSYNLKDDNIENQDLPTLKWVADLLDDK